MPQTSTMRTLLAWLSGVPMLARSFLLVCELRKAVIVPLLEFADLICRSATVWRANACGQGGLPLVPSPGERKKGGVCVCACFRTHTLCIHVFVFCARIEAMLFANFRKQKRRCLSICGSSPAVHSDTIKLLKWLTILSEAPEMSCRLITS